MPVSCLQLIAYWVFFVLIATSQAYQYKYSTGSSSCVVGCTSCSCTAGGGPWGGGAPGTRCNACANGPGQGFILQQGACVCRPGHGKVRQQVPPTHNYHGCQYISNPSKGYWGHGRGRLLLQEAPAAGAPATVAAPAQVPPLLSVPASVDDAGVAATPSSPEAALDSDSSSSSSSFTLNDGANNVTSSIEAGTVIGNGIDGHNSSSGSKIEVPPNNTTAEASGDVAARQQGAQQRATAAAADRAAAQLAANATVAERRQAALDDIAARHNATLAKARQAAAAAREAQRAAAAAATAATSNATRLRAKAVAAAAATAANEKQSAADKLEKAVADAQQRLAAKRARRKAAIAAKRRAQADSVAAKVARRKEFVRQPATPSTVLGVSSDNGSTTAVAAASIGVATPAAAAAAANTGSPNTQMLLQILQQQAKDRQEDQRQQVQRLQQQRPPTGIGGRKMGPGSSSSSSGTVHAVPSSTKLTNNAKVIRTTGGKLVSPEAIAQHERRVRIAKRRVKQRVRPGGVLPLRVAPGESITADPSAVSPAAVGTAAMWQAPASARARVPPPPPSVTAAAAAVVTESVVAAAPPDMDAAAVSSLTSGLKTIRDLGGSGNLVARPSKPRRPSRNKMTPSPAVPKAGSGGSLIVPKPEPPRGGSNTGIWPRPGTNTGGGGGSVAPSPKPHSPGSNTGTWPRPGDSIWGGGSDGGYFDFDQDDDFGYGWGNEVCRGKGDCWYQPNCPPPCSSCEDYLWVWVPCAPCPPGQVSPGGDADTTMCTPCPFGTVPNKDQTECVTRPWVDPGNPPPWWPPGLWPSPRPRPSPSPRPKPPSPSPKPHPGPSPKPTPSPSPRPPKFSPKPSPKPSPLVARNVVAFTLAPKPVWVDFRVSGSATPLTISVKGKGPKKGTLGEVDQKLRRVKYTPGPKYCSLVGAPDKFEYEVRDATGKTATATAGVVVDCPDSVFTEDQFVTTSYGVPVDIFTTVEGGVKPYKFSIVTPPEFGQVTQIAPSAGTVMFTYQPNDTYCSIDGFGDTFVFEVTEQYGSVAQGYIDITVLCPPGPEVAPELVSNMTPGTSLFIDLGVVGSGPFTFDVLSPPLNGALSNITNPGFTTYTPEETYCSMFDFYDGFYYTVYDKFGQFVDAAVTINVICPDPPYADTQYFETPAQVPLEQHLIVNSTAQLFFDISMYPSRGNIDGIDERGISIYTPDYDFCSMQDALDNWGFDVMDIFGQYAFALVFIKVTCPPAPKPVDQVIKMPAAMGLVINITLTIAVGTDPFYIETSIDPMNGFITPIMQDEANPMKAYTEFTPFDGFCNFEDIPDPFNWIVYDPFGQFGEATCSVILRCPDPPTARDQSVQVAVGEKEKLIRLQVTGSPPLDYLIYAPPGNGKLSKPTVDNTVIYTPDPDFCSLDGFQDTAFYMVSDVFGATADGSLSITVLCPPPPSAAENVFFTLNVGVPFLEIRPTFGPPGFNLTISVDDPPGFGTLDWDPQRVIFTYRPTGGTCTAGRTDDFIFAVDDVYGQETAYGQVTIECLRG